MNAPVKLRLICSIGLALLAYKVSAQNSIPSDYGQRIGDVVVSASLSGTELKNMTQNTTVLTNEDLNQAPDQTIDQVLKNQSSVFINDQPYYEKDPTGQGLNVRGLGTARTLVLIDGVPANDAMYGTIQWNLVPMSSIQDVEFIRGGVSNLYGNYGMGGVVNITTKPMKDNGNEVSMSYGSYGTENIAASKDIAVTDSFKLRVSADGFHTAGYVNAATIYPARNIGGVASSSVTSTATGATGLAKGMGPEFANGSNYRMQGSLKVSQDTDAFFNIGYHEMENLPTGGYTQGVKSTIESTFSGGAITQLSGSEKIKSNIYYENTTLLQQNITAATSSANPYVSRIDADPYSTIGGSVQYVRALTESAIDQFSAGVDARKISASNTGVGYNASGTLNGALAYAKGSQEFYGVSGEAKSKLDAIPLQVTLSARLDQWQSQVPTYVVNGVYTNAPNQTKLEFSPNLGLLYQVNNNLDFRASAYQGFHAPGLNNMLRSYGTSTYYLASPTLTPETMKGYEVGTDYRWKQGFVQLTAFNANVKNAIATASIDCASVGLTGTCNQYSNNQDLQSRGLEAQAHYDFNEQWATDATYTLTKTVLTSIIPSLLASNPTGSQLAGTPENMGSISLTYFATPRASITTNLRYVGYSWWDTLHTVEVPTYFVVGLRANYEVSQNVSLFASGVNLLNRNYVTYGGTSPPILRGQPQTGTIGARITF